MKLDVTLIKNQNMLAKALAMYFNADTLEYTDFSDFHRQYKELSKDHSSEKEYCRYNYPDNQTLIISRILDIEEMPPRYYINLRLEKTDRYCIDTKCLMNSNIFLYLNIIVAKALNHINYSDISSANLINRKQLIDRFSAELIKQYQYNKGFYDQFEGELKKLMNKDKLLDKNINDYSFEYHYDNSTAIVDNFRLGTICFTSIDHTKNASKYLYVPKSEMGISILELMYDTIRVMIKNRYSKKKRYHL